VRQAALVFSPPGLAELVSMYVTGGGNTISTEALVRFMKALDNPEGTLSEVESLLFECGGLARHPAAQVLKPYLSFYATDLHDNIVNAVDAFGFKKVYEFFMDPDFAWSENADIERLLVIALRQKEQTPPEMIAQLREYIDNVV
jgi:hypothetical protein